MKKFVSLFAQWQGVQVQCNGIDYLISEIESDYVSLTAGGSDEIPDTLHLPLSGISHISVNNYRSGGGDRMFKVIIHLKSYV
ncbi:hypothetical protein D9M68_599780 [compost metagenome]